MADIHEYEVDLHWNSERKGTLSSPVLPVQIEVATPPEFPKGMKDIWTPEHLLVAAVNACLMSTFLAIAENSKLEFISFQSNAIGTIDHVEGKLSFTEITLRPKVELSSLQQEGRVRRILEMSEKACAISNSLKSKIILEPVITAVTASITN
ncbi:MAG: osmotically inducible protein OsmC [Azospira oryzae]|jgi:peroxiredoxin-like protein|nr:MAG: osmotically inducible protein OsmC [Azospira oryzae]